MAITHVNRKQQTYYLHQGTTKTGKPRYFFAMKSESDLVETVPAGYEIYENPRAQVFLRKIPKKIITDEEIAIVEKGMKKFAKISRFMIDVKKEIISIFTPNQDIGELSAVLAESAYLIGRNPQELASVLEQSLDYTSDLQFVLVDKQKRIFRRSAIAIWAQLMIGSRSELPETSQH